MSSWWRISAGRTIWPFAKQPGLRFDGLRDEHARDKEPVYLGIQRGDDVVNPVPGDRKQVTFTAEFRIRERADGAPNFLGPYAHGRPADRFFYLSWGIRYVDGYFHMFRRLKIRLNHLTWSQIKQATKSKIPIVARLRMTDDEGGPLCGSPKEKHITWET